MRILLVITQGSEIGGAQLHVRDLALRLAEEGHGVLLATGSAGPLTEALERYGIPHVICRRLQRSLHPWRDLRACWELRRVLTKFKPDLVSAHSSKAGIIARIVCRLSGVPCVFTVHGWSYSGPKGRALNRRLERLVVRFTTQVICVSHYDRALGIEAGLNERRITVIHNGIADIAPDLRARPGDAKRPRIVMVARFEDQKDHATLLRAVADIPDVLVDLVGSGSRQGQIEKLAVDLGLKHRVCFWGAQPDVSPILASAHVFVLTSIYEGFPLTTLEAMRAGLPTIVTDVGGAAEAVLDGVTGYVIPINAVTELRSRLEVLLASPELRAAQGAAGRQRYEAQYTLDHMYRDTFGVFARTALDAGALPSVATPVVGGKS